MKKIILTFLSAGLLMLTGCLETTQEITLNKDGSGTISTTNDMGTLIGLAKNMGGGAEIEKVAVEIIDTTFSLASHVDRIDNPTEEEKILLKNGTIMVKRNMKEEQVSTRMIFPFSSLKEIVAINKLNAKVSGAAMKELMTNSPMAGQAMGDMPEPSSFEDYFDLKITDDKIERSINKEKYAKAASNEYLNGIKQASAMGIPVTSTLIINLPRPAEKVEGKNVKLSEDKMKVTVKTDIDDFFDYPEKLEFTVKF
jgi:hypothetical protein